MKTRKMLFLLLVFVLLSMPMTALCSPDIAAVPISASLPPLVIPVEGGSPSGVLVTDSGTVLITDIWKKIIWSWNGTELTRFAGAETDTDLLGQALGGNKDGSYANAAFRAPFAIAPYNGGYAVSDTDNNSIRLLKDGSVSTIASINAPTGLACGEDGNLYIASSADNAIIRMDKNGETSVFLGKEASLLEPMGLCWYDGILYIADSGNHRILTVDDGVVSVLAGKTAGGDALYSGSYRNGAALSAGFSSPQGVFACDGGVFVSDSGNGVLRLIKDGIVTTVSSGSELYPASPRGIAMLDNVILVCDLYAQLLFSTSAETPAADFADLPAENSAATGDISDVLAAISRFGVFRGDENGNFNPDTIITRAQFITVLGRFNAALYPFELITGYAVFDDIPENAYYAQAAAWGKDNAVLNGTGEGEFSPDLDITREAAAVLLHNYALWEGITAITDGVLRDFSDADSVSDWAKASVSWAAENGILLPETDGTINPKGTVSRADAARMFLCYLEQF